MEGISGIPTYTEESHYGETISKSIGRDDFLKLFVAQVNYQDPLNPMESQEFTAQLAQFSSVEQLYNVNENLEIIRSDQDRNSQFQVLGFIGKEVMAEGDLLSGGQGQLSTGGFVLDETADCTVVIMDGEGYPIRTLSLGLQGAGERAFEWDGRDDSGILQERGIYAFAVSALSPDGESIPVETRIRGPVSRVSLEQSEPLLYVGDIPLDISRVVDIRAPSSAEES